MKLHQQTLKDFKVSIGCIDSSPLLAIACHCLALLGSSSFDLCMDCDDNAALEAANLARHT